MPCKFRCKLRGRSAQPWTCHQSSIPWSSVWGCRQSDGLRRCTCRWTGAGCASHASRYRYRDAGPTHGLDNALPYPTRPSHRHYFEQARGCHAIRTKSFRARWSTSTSRWTWGGRTYWRKIQQMMWARRSQRYKKIPIRHINEREDIFVNDC